MEKNGASLTMQLSDYFLDSFDHIRKEEEVPYYIEAKIKSLACVIMPSDQNVIMNNIIKNDKAGLVFKYLEKNRILVHVFGPLYWLSLVPQDKALSKNAFEHAIKVIDEVPVDYEILRWVALFHDIGKHKSHTEDSNFNKHALYSYQQAGYYCDVFGLKERVKICSIVKNHMFPLDYQREPNWTDDAFVRFIDRCDGCALETAEFAYYDKKAENNVEEYLKPLLTFREEIKKRL